MKGTASKWNPSCSNDSFFCFAPLTLSLLFSAKQDLLV